jgi:hypothetical protein
MKPKSQTRAVLTIDNLNLDNNLDSEEWKRPEKRKINFEALRANNYKVELNKSIKY